MASCSEEAANNNPYKPAPARDASAAKPELSPANSGIERRKPNCTPEVVAKVVAPPGVKVDVHANRARGNNESVIMLLSPDGTGH